MIGIMTHTHTHTHTHTLINAVPIVKNTNRHSIIDTAMVLFHTSAVKFTHGVIRLQYVRKGSGAFGTQRVV